MLRLDALRAGKFPQGVRHQLPDVLFFDLARKSGSNSPAALEVRRIGPAWQPALAVDMRDRQDRGEQHDQQANSDEGREHPASGYA